jgi:hypothetical protein
MLNHQTLEKLHALRLTGWPTRIANKWKTRRWRA